MCDSRKKIFSLNVFVCLFTLIVMFFTNVFIQGCGVSNLKLDSNEGVSVRSNGVIVLYVSIDGNDGNDGLSVYSPFRNIQVAIEKARKYYNDGYSVEIRVEGGTFLADGIGLNHASNGVALSIISVREVTLIGGWDRSFTRVYTNTRLVGTNVNSRVSNVVLIKNSYKVVFVNFDVCYGGNNLTFGGGISIVNSDYITIGYNRIYNNIAKYGGGVSIVYSRKVRVGSEVFSNRSYYDGGGVYIDSSYDVYLSGYVDMNKGEYYGGGIAVYDSTNVNIHSSVRSNKAAYGGGVAVISYRGNCISNSVAGYFIGNVGVNGGGIFLKGHNNGVSLSSEVVSNFSLRGGGIYISGSSNLEFFPVVYGNYSTNEGGGIFIDNVFQFILKGISYLNCSKGGGGGICLKNSVSVKLEGTVMSNFSFTTGGGSLVENSIGVLVRGVVSFNFSSRGGGVYFNNVTNSTIDTQVINNFSSNVGGGVVSENGFFNIFSGEIVGNYSDGACGGISLSNEKFSTILSTVVSNTSIKGGSIYLTGCYKVVVKSVVFNNFASITTSGIFLEVRDIWEEYIITQSILSNNIVFPPFEEYGIFISNYISGFSGVEIVNTKFSGKDQNSYGIGEFGYNVTDHVLVSNVFYTNSIGVLYRNYDGFKISVSNWSSINDHIYTDARRAEGNLVF